MQACYRTVTKQDKACCTQPSVKAIREADDFINNEDAGDLINIKIVELT